MKLSIFTICLVTAGMALAVNAIGSQSAPKPPRCLVSDTTNAISVQKDLQDRRFNCSRLHTPDGRPLENLLRGGRAGFEVVDSPASSLTDSRRGKEYDCKEDYSCEEDEYPGATEISWWVNPVELDENGTPGTYPVYWVSTEIKQGNGSCNYVYDGEATEGQGLGSENRQLDLKSIFVCGDPEPVPVAQDIITTADDDCQAVFQLGEDERLVQDLTFGYSLGDSGLAESVAACVASTADPKLAQIECIPPSEYVQQVPSGDCTPNEAGELPLSCAPIDVNAAQGGEYCWYYQNRVCEADSGFSYCKDRTRDTYIPKTLKGVFDVQVLSTEGSTCYTYFLYGRAYFTCF